MDDFGIREYPVGVVPMHKCIVNVVHTFRVELIFLDELTLLIDAVSGFDHGLLSWNTIGWVLLSEGEREVKLFQCCIIVRRTHHELWSFNLLDYRRSFLEEVVDLDFGGRHEFVFRRE